MKYLLRFLIVTGVLFMSCSQHQENPFYTKFNTPFQTPPFEKIKEEHYMPAFKKGMEDHNTEIAAIVSDTAAPIFANTIEAMENSGALLSRVSSVFFNLNSAETNDNLQAMAKVLAPQLSSHRDNIMLNEGLFAKIKQVYENREKANLDAEQLRVLDEYYKDFVRGGANLNGEQKKRFREINQELAKLTNQFGQNVLAENNRFEMVLDNKGDLAGLPEGVISAAAETAKKKGYTGKWVFTIHKPSLIPFLQYSEKRALREKMFKAYIQKGDHNDNLDNKKILSRIAALRVERANLLGFKSHAAFVLDRNMAKTPENVYALMDKVWKPALAKAKVEAKDIQLMIDKEGEKFKLQPWDWWYYSEKVKKAKYDLDEEMLRPYFVLENVRNGAFEVAHRLYGISFEERKDIPVYNPEVKVFEVKDEDGSHLGILYVDYFPRAGKRGGAWMNNYIEQHYENGKDIRPVICNVGNFSRPTGDKPALLSLDEVLTLFHEFGHAMHGMLSKAHYEKVSGTNVSRDFVEMPSQIMENWALEPEVMKLYAKHYQTGEIIPQELIQKIKNSGHFNQGFATTEFMAAAYLDMDWHTLTEAKEMDVIPFENAAMKKIGLIPEIVVRYRSTYFSHIFSGGYSAGYYSYLWAEVLDADAFQAFKENGIFDRKTGLSFRKNILEKGNTEDPMVLYKRFRGAEPGIKPLLARRGLN